MGDSMAEEVLARLQIPAAVYKPAIGHVLCKASEWLASLSVPPWADTFEGWDIIHLGYIAENPWWALAYLGVDAEPLKQDSQYSCPFTGYTHFSIVPHSILTKHSLPYSARAAETCGHRADYAMDFDWMAGFHEAIYWKCEPTAIMKMLLGSGYTSATLPTDGHGKIQEGVVALTNGDYLRVNFWEWYNK